MAYSFVQQTSVSSKTAANTITAGVFPEPSFTAGNLLVYVAKYTFSSQQLPITITDTLNNTWQEIGNYWDGNTGLTWGFAQNITGGLDNIQAQFDAQSPTYVALYVAEFSGLDTISPYTNGEFHIQKQVAPGTVGDAVASGSTPQISKQPVLVFGFSLDGTNTTGEDLTAGLGFTQLADVWQFGSGGQTAALPEHKRYSGPTIGLRCTYTASVGTDTYYTLVMIFAEQGDLSPIHIVSSGVFITP